MKTFLAIAVALSLALAALVVLDGYRGLNGEVRTLSAANVELQNQVDRLEQRITALTLDASAPVSPSSTGRGNTIAATATSRQSQQIESTDALRTLIADMIAAEREANQVRVRTAIDANIQRWTAQNRQNNTDGLNSRGQRLRDVLDLDVAQMVEYQTLTESFERRAEALYADVSATDMDTFSTQLARVNENMAALSAEFDAAFTAVLTAQQAQTYADLPQDSRGLAQDFGVQALEFDLADMLRLAETD